MSTVQKIGLAFAIIAVVVFLAYTSAKEGGFDSLRHRITSVPSQTPDVSVSVVISSVQPSASVAPSIIPTATPPLPTLSPISASAATAILSAINARRREAGVAPLATVGVLQVLAQTHAADMATRGYFSHTDPSGTSFQQRIQTSGYSGSATAENLGLTSGAAVEVVDGWMGSEGHRLNMLNSAYTQVGIGVANGPWQGFSAVFAVAVFGNAK
jgi:uncharacterized protein YkwD